MLKTRKILIHVTFWVIYLVLPAFILPEPSAFFRNNQLQLFIYFMVGLFSVGFYYFNYFIAFPKLFFKRKYIFYIISILGFVFISLVLTRVISHFAFTEVSFLDSRRPNLMINYITRFILILIISSGIRINQRHKEIETDKVKAELLSLKSQINPHFLFNILNDIYGQAISNSDRTADSIAKLSSIMRHVITEVNQEKISIKKEIKYLNDYVKLQEIRLTKKTNIVFDIGENINHQEVPPLLFINFIENAFKYGVSNEVDSNIFIQITSEENCVILVVVNDIITNIDRTINSNNIGLQNTKRRLDLIFGDRYILNIKNEKGKFRVYLKICVK